MRRHCLTTAQLAFVVGTLSKAARRRLGTALVALGALTTFPALRLLGRR